MASVDVYSIAKIVALIPSWSTLAGKPAVIAAGVTQAEARTAIGAGTSSFDGVYSSLTGKPNIPTTAAQVSAQPATQSINAQTGTSYTPVAGDANTLVTCTNAASITVTLPQDSAVTLPIGSRIDFVGLGAGKITFVAGSGATANATPSLVTRAQYSAVTAIKRSANTWLIVGDLATP